MKRTLSLMFSTMVFLLSCASSFGWPPVAADDFYVIDRGQEINTYLNDTNPGGFWGVVDSPLHGTVLWNNWDPYSCGYCPRFSPHSNYTGSDLFTYRYNPGCCYNPPGPPSSNTATVTLLIIGSDDAQNAGDSCQLPIPTSVGQPVNVTNGNMWLEQTDYNLSGIGENLEINRFYNSIIQTSGLFGFGFSTKYDESLIVYDDRMVRLNQPNGRAAYFGRANTANPFTSFSPDISGQLVKNADGTYTLTFKDGSVHHFGTNGTLQWQRDRNGNQTALTYDTGGLLTAITDAAGRTLAVVSNTNGTIAQISDSLGTVADYEYNLDSTLKTVTYPDASKYKFEYVTSGTKTYLATVKDALDNILETHIYDTLGRATTSEKHGGAEKYTLNYSNPAFTTVTDALGRITKYHFTRKYGTNLITKTEGVCGGCGGGGSEITEFFYDDKLNLVKKLDALSKQTLYTYDGSRNLLTEVDVLGTQKFTYNSLGQIATYKDRIDSTSPTAVTLTNTYSASGNLLTSKDALNNTTTFTYTALGQPATVKDALNNTTTLTYDTFGRLTQIKDANNKNTIFAYDTRARLIGTTNAINETVNLEYDLNNRLKKVIYPDTNFITYSYDLAGRRTGMTDARNNTTTYAYDSAYRLTGITDALNHTNTIGYDLMSNMTSQADALGNITNYEYDDFNRHKKTVHPPSASGAPRLEERLEYDTVGNVKKRIDTAGRETLYDYDAAHRLIKTTDALSQITQFEYNARSQMTKVTDALAQQYTFTYDPLGRQLSQTRAGSIMSFQYDAAGNRTKRIDYTGRETGYEYDVLNRLKKINYLSPGNPTPQNTAIYNYDDLSRLTTAINEAGTVAFTYDNRGRMKTTTDVFNHLIEYNYDQNGNRTQLKLDGTVHTGYIYDTANRLTTLTDEASQNFTFGYDIANRLIAKTLPNGVSSTFDYDGMNRLTKLKHQSTTATLVDNNLTFFPSQQISQITELAQTKNFAYDNADQLTAMTNGTANENYAFDSVGNRTGSHKSATYGYQPFNKLTSTATATYSYDANGNMLSKSDAAGYWIYAWDYENRMTSARKQNKIVRYQYDALGRRVSRQGKTLGSTKYIYDGLDVVMDDDFYTGIVKYQGGLGIDDKLKMTVGGQAKYFLQDHLGSTLALTNSSGAVTEQTNYDSFGNPTANLSTRYPYTGREFDNFTGLHFYRARWYDANLGRFISEDPIGFGGGDMNLFGYVRNQPLFYRDPLGLQPGEALPYPDIWRQMSQNASRIGPAIGAAAGVVAAFVPPAAVVAGAGAGAIYGASVFGNYTANHPSNPFVNGPWNPFGNPYPGVRPLPPAITSTSTAKPYCESVPRTIPFFNWPPIKYPIPLGPYPPQTPEKYEECYQKCQHLLGIGDYGVQFSACVRRCTGRID